MPGKKGVGGELLEGPPVPRNPGNYLVFFAKNDISLICFVLFLNSN